MKNRFEIIETTDYVLAVSDEEIKEGDWFYITGGHPIGNGIRVCHYIYDNGNYEQLMIDKKEDKGWGFCKRNEVKKIIAYQPKNNAPELDIPLLPEIVVEDDVRKLAQNYKDSQFEDIAIGKTKTQAITASLHAEEGFYVGYKSAAKVYSEEDLRKAIQYGRQSYKDIISCVPDPTKEKISIIDDRFIKSLKQPKWFVAETEYDCCNRYQNCIGCDATAEMINLRLKTTTINNKTYLVGTYLNQ